VIPGELITSITSEQQNQYPFFDLKFVDLAHLEQWYH